MIKKLKVVELLNKFKIKYRIIELKDKAVSYKDVLKHSKGEVNPNEVFKTIIVVDKNNKKYAFVVKADRMVDFTKVKKIVGNKVSLANKKELNEEGFEPGTVCPFLVNIPLYVDKELFQFKKFNCGSGDLHYGLEVRVEDLKNVKNYEVVDVEK